MQRLPALRDPKVRDHMIHSMIGIQWPLMKQFLWLASIPTVLPSMLPQLERRFASDLQRKKPVYVPQIVGHFVVKYTPYRVKPFPLKAPHFSQCTVQSPKTSPHVSLSLCLWFTNLSGYHGNRSCVVVWVTLGEVCCVLAMMFEVVMVKESKGCGGCGTGGPLSQCPLTAAAIPLRHEFIRSETTHAIEKSLLAIISPYSLSLSLLPICPPPSLPIPSLPNFPLPFLSSLLFPPPPFSQVLERETELPVMREKRGRLIEQEED